MKTSIFYLGIFTAGILTGLHVEWNSWLYGVAFGVSIFNLVMTATKGRPYERR